MSLSRIRQRINTIDRSIVELTCQRLDVDAAGLDEMDRRLLTVLIEHYDGGPVGVETIAAALAELRAKSGPRG